jgi:predicted RNase H-like nuclease (RuvC/YqgF family)
MSELQEEYISKLEGMVRELRQQVAALEDRLITDAGVIGDLQRQLAACEKEREYNVQLECAVVNLRQQVVELESTWLSPETYEKLMQERQETLQQLAACQAECEEEARLNGMGSEREAALMAKPSTRR